MRPSSKIAVFRLPIVVAILALFGAPAGAQQPAAPQQPVAPTQQPAAPAQGNEQLDVHQLFATTCGWCHSDGGRAAGKGPQLMNTKRDDDFIRNRIKNGKPGAMPAFGGMFSDAQIDEIIKYIHDLKPHEG